MSTRAFSPDIKPATYAPTPTARAAELFRLAPQGIRAALAPVATGTTTIEELPADICQWLVNHNTLHLAPGGEWDTTDVLDALLRKIKVRYQ